MTPNLWRDLTGEPDDPEFRAVMDRIIENTNAEIEAAFRTSIKPHDADAPEQRAAGWRKNTGECPVKDERTRGDVLTDTGGVIASVQLRAVDWGGDWLSAYRITEPYGADVPEQRASADPHDDPATRWESGPDGEWTIVPLWDGRPEWLRDDDAVRFSTKGDWLAAWSYARTWETAPAFFLRRRPQVDEGLVALIESEIPPSDPIQRKLARDIARALVAAGRIKEGA